MPIGADPWEVQQRPRPRRVEVDERHLLDALLCASLAGDLLPAGLPAPVASAGRFGTPAALSLARSEATDRLTDVTTALLLVLSR